MYVNVPLATVTPPSYVVREVLAGIADDPQPVGSRVEVDAKGRSHQRHRQCVDERRLGTLRIERVDAAAIADAVQFPILHAEIDPDERRVGAVETADVPDLTRSLGGRRSERH